MTEREFPDWQLPRKELMEAPRVRALLDSLNLPPVAVSAFDQERTQLMARLRDAGVAGAEIEETWAQAGKVGMRLLRDLSIPDDVIAQWVVAFFAVGFGPNSGAPGERRERHGGEHSGA